MSRRPGGKGRRKPLSIGGQKIAKMKFRPANSEQQDTSLTFPVFLLENRAFTLRSSEPDQSHRRYCLLVRYAVAPPRPFAGIHPQWMYRRSETNYLCQNPFDAEFVIV